MKSIFKSSKIIIATLFIFIFAASIAFGSNSSKISVSFENLKYYVQGKQINANSKTPGFIYEGTTYVPLRFIGESLGQNVAWDSKTKAIKMTNNSSSNSEAGYQAEIDRLNAEISKLKQELSTLKHNNDTSVDPQTDKATYKEYKHGNYTLLFTPTAYKDYGYLDTDFNNITKTLFNYFGVKDISFPVKVYIQSSKDRIDRPNSGAFYESGERIVVLNPDENFKMAGEDSVKFVFIHELTHTLQDDTWGFEVLHKVTGGEKNWILEGHADYVAKKLSGYTQYGINGDPAGESRTQEYYYNELQYRNGANGWAPLNWSEITTFQRLSLHRDEYFSFEAFVNFVAENYSLNHYRLLMDEMAKGNTGAQAIQTVFKKSDVQLMNEYKVFYKLK